MKRGVKMKFLENKLAEFNKTLPQIPDNGKSVIANILWILIIISIVFNIIGIITLLGVGSFGVSVLAGFGLGFHSMTIWGTIIFGVIGMAIVVVLEIIAIKPLKDKAYLGWRLAFYVIWIQLIFSVLNDIFLGTVSGLIGVIIGTIIALFILMQVRDYFIPDPKSTDPESPDPENS